MGGIYHALIHGGLTFFVTVWYVSPALALWGAFMDAFVHYHLDFVKASISKDPEISEVTEDKLVIKSQLYFDLLGFDQFCHHVTYFLLALAMAGAFK